MRDRNEGLKKKKIREGERYNGWKKGKGRGWNVVKKENKEGKMSGREGRKGRKKE